MKKPIYLLFSLVILFFLTQVLLAQTGCDGCIYNTKCYPYGRVLVINGNSQYCDSASDSFVNQKTEGVSCKNDFECLGSLLCLEEKCIDIYREVEGVVDLYGNLSSTSDSDGDGVPDTFDNCVNVSNPDQNDMDGDGIGDLCDDYPEDYDNDAVNDSLDNCINVSNPDQLNNDTDTFGNACDNCPYITNQNQSDVDQDTVGDVCDNCPSVNNTLQIDTDGDGFGNLCDNDDDNDTINDSLDNCPLVANLDQANNDTDTYGDACDNCFNITNQDQNDTDGDGWGDACDNCEDDYNPGQEDGDGDGQGDACEPSTRGSTTGGTTGGTTTNTYTINENVFKKGYNQILCEGDIVRIALFGDIYSMAVLEVNPANVKIQLPLMNIPQLASLSPGYISKFDLIGNGYYDAAVKLNSIESSNCANMTLKYIQEPITTAEARDEGREVIEDDGSMDQAISHDDAEDQGGVETERNLKPYIWGIIIFVIIAIVIIAAIAIIKSVKKPKTSKTVEKKPSVKKKRVVVASGK